MILRLTWSAGMSAPPTDEGHRPVTWARHRGAAVEPVFAARKRAQAVFPGAAMWTDVGRNWRTKL